VTVVLEASELELSPEGEGYFEAPSPQAEAGGLYRFRLDSSKRLLPDPASRFQPQGPHGPSEIVDPGSYSWSGENAWKGVKLAGQVLYELHIGTFTPEGTYAAAAEKLPHLKELGATALEILPLSDFPGRFGWGYDGVSLFAPSRLYGRPDDLRRFIDDAHELGIAVILDVVYNHLGPDGNYIAEFAPRFFNPKIATDWGAAIHFDGPGSGPVREFYLANARYWIEEFHFDGLRFDATQDIHDASSLHILTALAREARAAAGEREVLLVAENEPQNTGLVRPQEVEGYGLDALWNDDFHHSARVALTGRSEAYYTDYLGSPQELLSGVKWGYLYQGQHYHWQGKRRGTPGLDLDPAAFVNYLENHDQTANSARGERLHSISAPARYRAMTALLLLAPGTPMLFQGQEFASSAPFPYFADQAPEIASLVREGRKKFLAQFESLALEEVQARIPDPGSEETFMSAKLDWSERERNAEALALHRDLLRLRREDPVLQRQVWRGIDGAVLSPSAFVVRYFSPDGQDRLLLVNLGSDLHFDPAPEPLLAPPSGRLWSVLFSTADVRYGGTGTPSIETEHGFHVPGETAVVLVPEGAARRREPASGGERASEERSRTDERSESRSESAGGGAPGDLRDERPDPCTGRG
jgi:maltooligosyltrehalose trehalohydrolase